ncbi:YSC84-related protein [Paraburkholderia sp. J7]|uniref:BPSL1445 family SYLF domain-containing lipoprotein n=1 Tax=Paraburkholderia sp. J7 TaxID=2805438 RepID=UPI002AB62D5E|nr:YSC84-related protein [Paraburkholderia sp. J7]
MNRRNVLCAAGATIALSGFALTGCTMTGNSAPTAAGNSDKRQSIDAGVDGTMSRLYTTVGGSRELVAKANGILVFPSIIEAGFIVGARYGEGALRVGGASVGYYSTVSGSFGFEVGAQSKALIFLFMTQDALAKFRSSKGWTAGVDSSVALVRVGANGVIDATTATEPVECIVLTNAGLMANLSLQGTNVSPLDI